MFSSIILTVRRALSTSALLLVLPTETLVSTQPYLMNTHLVIGLSLKVKKTNGYMSPDEAARRARAVRALSADIEGPEDGDYSVWDDSQLTRVYHHRLLVDAMNRQMKMARIDGALAPERPTVLMTRKQQRDLKKQMKKIFGVDVEMLPNVKTIEDPRIQSQSGRSRLLDLIYRYNPLVALAAKKPKKEEVAPAFESGEESDDSSFDSEERRDSPSLN